MPDSSSYNWISSVAAALSALAASVSAVIARQAQKRARDEGTRRLFREAQMSANRVISSSLQVDDIAARLKQELISLGVFTHRSGSDALGRVMKSAEEKQNRVSVLANEAKSWLENHGAIGAFTEDSLTEYAVRFDRDHTNVVRVIEELERTLASIEAQNRMYMQEALASRSP